MRIPHAKPTLAMSIGILLVATAWSSVAIASNATPATKPTSQPQSSAKAHLQALSPAEQNLLHKAAQGDANAQFNLGWMYAKGQGVPQDYAKALYWYRKSAAQRYAKAQYNLGVMYAKGQGVPQDYAKAVYWYRKAAAQGVANAQNNLGVMYAKDQGVPQDYAKAVYWYRKAAAQGLARAQFNLGAMYYLGRGVPRDYVQAAKWIILAKAGGVENVNKALSFLEQHMTPAQLTEAKRLANQWRKAHHKQ